jgi:aldehyde dehydrogenase (NAD+)
MFKNLINGEWVAGSRVSRNINPSDTRDLVGESVGEYTQGDAAQAGDASGAAQAAFPAWSVRTPPQRCDILDAVGMEILERRAFDATAHEIRSTFQAGDFR